MLPFSIKIKIAHSKIINYDEFEHLSNALPIVKTKASGNTHSMVEMI